MVFFVLCQRVRLRLLFFCSAAKSAVLRNVGSFNRLVQVPAGSVIFVRHYRTMQGKWLHVFPEAIWHTLTSHPLIFILVKAWKISISISRRITHLEGIKYPAIWYIIFHGKYDPSLICQQNGRNRQVWRDNSETCWVSISAVSCYFEKS